MAELTQTEFNGYCRKIDALFSKTISYIEKNDLGKISEKINDAIIAKRIVDESAKKYQLEHGKLSDTMREKRATATRNMLKANAKRDEFYNTLSYTIESFDNIIKDIWRKYGGNSYEAVLKEKRQEIKSMNTILNRYGYTNPLNRYLH